MTLFRECLWNQLLVLAKFSAKKLFDIRLKISGYYVTLFNILVTAKLWGETSKFRMLIKESGITKAPGCI
jgi:hypothetical protein